MKCPTCDKDFESIENPFRPFCSERCKLVDLGRWIAEGYRVPSQEKAREETPSNADED
jgi:endogenous inhibitor of DNA gyrase (YacG/DUF329 family)